MHWKGQILENIHAGYDATQGNILSFGVKRSYEGTHDKGSGSPRDDFYTWTSQFAQDRIEGTPKEILLARAWLAHGRDSKRKHHYSAYFECCLARRRNHQRPLSPNEK